MIFKIENTRHIDQEINKNLGKSYSKEALLKGSGSCLYNLVSLQLANTKDDWEINASAICLFEAFENGLLLRINDMQNYYVLPLSTNEKFSIEITGGEKIVPLSLPGSMFNSLGISGEYLKQFILFRGKPFNERFALLIHTEDELLTIDSHGKNFDEAMRYFERSAIQDKIK